MYLHPACEVGNVGHSRTAIDGSAITRSRGSDSRVVVDFEVVDEGHALADRHGENMLEDLVEGSGRIYELAWLLDAPSILLLSPSRDTRMYPQSSARSGGASRLKLHD